MNDQVLTVIARALRDIARQIPDPDPVSHAAETLLSLLTPDAPEPEPQVKVSTAEALLSGQLDIANARAAREPAIIEGLFRVWQDATGHPKAKLTPGRRKIIQTRLAQGYKPSVIAAAFKGAALSDWHMGRDRATNGKAYNDIGTILRVDKGQLEGHADRYLDAGSSSSPAQGSSADTPPLSTSWAADVFGRTA